MALTIHHDRRHESLEAKARWFQSLSLDERMDIFCEFTDLALSVNPDLKDFFILSKEDLIKTKQASAREVDLEDVRLLQLPDQDKETH